MAKQPSSTPKSSDASADVPPAPAVDAPATAPAAPAEAAPVPAAAAPKPATPPDKAPAPKAPATKSSAAKKAPAAKPVAAKPATAKAPAPKAPKVAARAAAAPSVKAPAKPAPKSATPPAAPKAPAEKRPVAPKSAPAARGVAARAPSPEPAAKTSPRGLAAKIAAVPKAALDRITEMTEQSPLTSKLPPQFRELAERNVDQAKKAYEQYVSTTERLLNTIEDATRQAWSGARDVNLRMLGFADANAKAGFDYAERVVKAKDVKEMASLQQEYLKEATERLGQQMREIQQLASQATKDTMKAVNPKG